jgi:radial spoke head protein 9
MVESIDFLDPVHEDIPKDCWTLTKDKVSNTVTIRSLHWPGYYAFHVAGTNMYGSAYFGNGEQNYNLGFML